MTDRDTRPEPRGLRREDAAYYIGVGTTKFDELVRDGRMPGPRRIDGRKIWDRFSLDTAFADLPGEHDDRTNPNTWDETDAHPT